MAEPEGAKPTPNPEAAKPAATGAVDGHEICGHAGGGNLKGGGIRRAFFRGTVEYGNRQAAAAAGVGGVTAFLTAWFLAFFRFFLPRHSFRT